MSGEPAQRGRYTEGEVRCVSGVSSAKSMMRLRHMIQLGPSPRETHALSPMDEVTFAPMDALADGLGGLDTSQTKPLNEVMNGGYNYFSEGDVLLAKVTPCFENGKKAIGERLSNGVGFATSEVHVIRPERNKIDTRFLRFLLCSEDFRAECMKSMTGAGGLRRVSENGVLNFCPKITDLDTQKIIANFLDRETARVDQLIEKKQRLVDLADEKRAALITAAVAGRIESEAREHHTPEESEGSTFAFPEYRLKYLAMPIVDEAFSTKDKGPFIGLEAISSLTGMIDLTLNQESEESTGNRFRPGDVLFGKLRPYLAKVALPEFAGHCSGEALVLRPRSRIVSRFLRYRMVEAGVIDAISASTYGAKMPRASWNFIGNLRIPVPSPASQKAIADFLDRETARIDALKTKTLDSINRLREYRSALITAAVTGQIDIATWNSCGRTDRNLDAIGQATQK